MDPLGVAFDDYGVDDMIGPRLTPAVPQWRQAVDDVGDHEDHVEDDGDGVAADAAPEPDGAAGTGVAYRDAQGHLSERLAPLRAIHDAVIEREGDGGQNEQNKEADNGLSWSQGVVVRGRRIG